MTPYQLTPILLRLPPILYVIYRTSMSGCSKAPWGLSVQSRVTCIFTGTSISPGPSLRQCPSRYTFRAGRNLPDKEFRYLRTVIVTAAVHWGFDSMLACPHEKVILFSKNRWIFATAKGNGRLFVENTQSLFEKSKTDVQGAENRFV